MTRLSNDPWSWKLALAAALALSAGALAADAPPANQDNTATQPASPAAVRIAPPPKLDRFQAMLMGMANFENKDFRRCGKDTGCVHPKASLLLDRRQTPCALALDADDPKARRPSLLRIDLSGRGDFADTPTLALTTRRGNTDCMDFQTPALACRIGDMDAAIAVAGSYYDFRRRHEARYLRIALHSALQGRCRFGQRELVVALIDGNNNLAYQDGFRPPQRRGGGGDFIAVYAPDEAGKPAGKPLAWTMAGCPIALDGAYYHVTYAPDKGFTAAATGLQTGRLHLGMDEWTLVMASAEAKGALMAFSGGQEDQPLPVGTYRLWGYRLGNEQCSLLAGDLKAPTLRVEPDGRVELSLLPLRPRITPSVRGREATFNFEMTDAAGNRTQFLNEAGRSVQPGLEVLDESGTVIYRAKLEFG